ncbi:hypothetical protein NEPAR06_1657 [Nematocida parisii]|uniref:Secreted protein n=1 Tax=Nematocida parisii (strain ERTm3) TaxID=935791 RepID=I3EKI1_NEMP3|nr:uncharacterized protein NEPG_00735 [Nematocida parisii ERTm1]EIJ89728.1 hypothetical protein NEQG_00498 [Nematocida parisii ERTm3]KAI5129704.1 hypothetical protein NEPAR08_1686 [Nematocida parisii]EIJ94069.1 hypothetical protein NEPG_00735 [Nematocida parisii ERTm1]KAI5129736.1 hypothetical protein NEPAR03_1771 [Nematocida parisii]KAI5142798.1 hypothetical protein NEPAR04_1620 [Nematocida parisii]|eukprot:XP_013058565.1 hypothetical protein NEPG_00735 [Nematocida parisii ERTm1]
MQLITRKSSKHRTLIALILILGLVLGSRECAIGGHSPADEPQKKKDDTEESEDESFSLWKNSNAQKALPEYRDSYSSDINEYAYPYRMVF